MSVEVTKGTLPQTVDIVDWEPPMPPTDLIFDDGALGSNRHRVAMNTLIRSLQQAWADRNDFFTKLDGTMKASHFRAGMFAATATLVAVKYCVF